MATKESSILIILLGVLLLFSFIGSTPSDLDKENKKNISLTYNIRQEKTPGKLGSPNIILITIESLRPDHMGMYGYDRNITPRLDELAQKSSVFKNAYSHTPWTQPALASIITGHHPAKHGVRNWSTGLNENLTTLAEILRAANYETHMLGTMDIFLPKHQFIQGIDKLTFRNPQEGNLSDHKAISTSE